VKKKNKKPPEPSQKKEETQRKGRRAFLPFFLSSVEKKKKGALGNGFANEERACLFRLKRKRGGESFLLKKKGRPGWNIRGGNSPVDSALQREKGASSLRRREGESTVRPGRGIRKKGKFFSFFYRP